MADNTPERDSEQDNLFKEIDEELRQEKMTLLWKRYGNYIIGVAILLIGCVSAFQGWQAWDTNRRSKDSAQFAAGLMAANQQRSLEAIQTFSQLAKDGSKGYATLSRLNQAALQAKEGDKSGSLASYEAISKDGSVDPIFRDLALLLATFLELDKANPDDLIQRITHLTKASNPWRHSAKEIFALLNQRKGDKLKAGKIYQELADDVTAPPGIRSRAAEMNAILGSS